VGWWNEWDGGMSGMIERVERWNEQDGGMSGIVE